MKILMEENVQKKKSKRTSVLFGSSMTTYFMILTNQPRLFMLTQLKEDKDMLPVKQHYVKDIMLYPGIKALLVQKTQFNILCKVSNKTYQFKCEGASQWVKEINEAVANL